MRIRKYGKTYSSLKEFAVDNYDRIYDSFCDAVEEIGVGERTLPSKMTQAGVVLSVLYSAFNMPESFVSKRELSEICASVLEKRSVDLQTPRHLKQQGWNIEGVQQGRGYAYRLVDLAISDDFLGVARRKEKLSREEFSMLVESFGGRCASCGELCDRPQQGHLNPDRPLSVRNCIPQCGRCNRAYSDYFVLGLRDNKPWDYRTNLYKPCVYATNLRGQNRKRFDVRVYGKEILEVVRKRQS